MTPRRRTRTPEVVVLGSPGALATLGPKLSRLGVPLLRVQAIDQVPVARLPPLPLPRLGRRNLLLVTSSAAVDLYLRMDPRALARWKSLGEVWASGPATAKRLRDAGLPGARVPPVPGAGALVRAVEPVRGSYVVRPRSDLAGPQLARALRLRGASVADLVVYRTVRAPRAGRHGAPKWGQVWIVTSPSALSAWKRAVGERTFRDLGRNARLVALGATTARAARGHGLRGVVVPDEISGQSLPALLVTLLADARQGGPTAGGEPGGAAPGTSSPLAPDRRAPRARR